MESDDREGGAERGRGWGCSRLPEPGGPKISTAGGAEVGRTRGVSGGTCDMRDSVAEARDGHPGRMEAQTKDFSP